MSRSRTVWFCEGACAFTTCFLPASSAGSGLTNPNMPGIASTLRKPGKFALAFALFAVFGAALTAQTAHFSGSTATLGGGFSTPYGVAVDGSGNVYMTDFGTGSVKEMPAGCASSSCVITLAVAEALPDPIAVGVDGSGNVYVAENDFNVVKKIPLGCASSSCVTTIGGGFSSPWGLAVDGSGNVYVSESNAVGAVKEIPPGCASSSCVIVLGGGFSYPDGLAVDGSGNVYVAEGVVKKMPAGCASSSCVTTLGGISLSQSVALDGSGNVYVANGPTNTLQELPAGCASSSCVIGLGSGFNYPWGVAVDGRGNVYVADSGNSAVKEVMLKSVDFFSAPVGSAGPVRTLTFTFDATVVISSVRVLTMGAANQDFTNAGTGSCIGLDKHTYGPGDTCTIDVAFSPKWAGTRNGAVILTNSANVPIATAYIHGIGTGPQAAFTPSAISTLGGGFASPVGMAVDGSGNVYVTDYDNDVVQEMPAGCASSSCLTALGGGFYTPSAVAVDGGGNVYVADTGHNTVKEMPAGCASSSCVTTLGGTFSFPIGIAVDGSGNVYVSAYTVNGVTEMPPGCASSSCVTTLGGGFYLPYGIAVGGSGKVYVADYGHDVVKVMPPGCASVNCVTEVGGGFTDPQGVAVDGSENVYVADTLNNAVSVAPAGCTSSSCVTPLGSGFKYPIGMAVDGSGNVYVADNENVAVKEIGRATPPSLSFKSTAVGSTSSDSPQTATVQNIGTAALSFSAVTYAKDFPEAQGVSTDCATTKPVASGASCTLSIDFTPLVSSITGNTTALSESVSLKDNHLNGTNVLQSVAVGGTGMFTAPSITSPSAGTLLGGSTVFVWNPGTGASKFQLYIGTTGAGSHDLYQGPDLAGTVTSSASINIPANGATLYVRLWYLLSNSWYYHDYTWTETSNPVVISPSTSTLLGGPTTFTWDPGVGVSSYQVYVGTTGTGSSNLYRGPDLPGTATSSAAVNIPGNGATVYVRLWYEKGASWFPLDYTYTEATAPSITSPSLGTLLGGSIKFTWNPGTGVSEFELYIGTTGVGSSNIYRGPDLPSTTTSSAAITIPANGATLYVRLWYVRNNSWFSQDYVYTEATPPSVSTPAPGSTIGGPTTFTWNPGTSATGFQLYVGTTGAGSHNVYQGPDLSGSVISSPSIAIPTTGATLNVRLWYLMNGSWLHQDYTYTETP